MTTYIVNGQIVDKKEVNKYLEENKKEIGFKFEIKEVLVRNVEVYGETYQSSVLATVKLFYEKEKIILDSEDLIDLSFTYKEVKFSDQKEV